SPFPIAARSLQLGSHPITVPSDAAAARIRPFAPGETQPNIHLVSSREKGRSMAARAAVKGAEPRAVFGVRAMGLTIGALICGLAFASVAKAQEAAPDAAADQKIIISHGISTF